MSAGGNKMDPNLTGMWVSFFTTAGIPSDVAATYALTFTENRIQNDMLLDLNKEYLRDMGISRMGDVIAILRHAKQVHESTARDRVLSTTAVSNKVPVAAITGRATVTAAQPSSPTSRILERYTRNPPAPVPSAPPAQPKRKSDEGIEVQGSGGMNIKKARLIRFATPPPPTTTKEVSSSKQTVFSRLGNSEPVKTTQMLPVKTTQIKVVANKPDAKPIFSRLGSKLAKPDIPPQKDALKYEGILKSQPFMKKSVTVTTTKNSVRRIATECTMRADETPVSVKDKLALPKAKSVKFSNTVQYKEFETNNKLLIRPKITPVFNKPERRLAMPEPVNNGVKSRLGTAQANVTKKIDVKETTTRINNLTITRNVFNRLGV